MKHQAAARRPTALDVTPAPAGLLQRKCNCGQHTGGGMCEHCRNKKKSGDDDLVGTLTTGNGTSLGVAFSRDFSRVPSTRLQACPDHADHRLKLGAMGDRFEREAEAVADAVMTSRLPLHIGAEEAGRRVQRSVDSAVTPAPTLSGAPLGSGMPLDGATRSYFEDRMGHDFGNVRIHHDDRAATAASSLHARAFTQGSHIVFGTGEYAPQTRGGRHLLAHELTHTIQQGATKTREDARGLAAVQPAAHSDAPDLQCLCVDLATPPPMSCQVGRDSPGSSATFVEFAVNSAVLSPAALATVRSVAAAWHAGGGVGVLRLDGFASVEGNEVQNCPLSCDRANAVATELMAPSNGAPGVPAANIETFAQGETSQFSGSLAPNRRVVITTTGGAPAPGPACGLAITGPLEVDHYCAAYVPSDAAACGVFPAPNITLTAAGAAPGTTPRWSVIRGGATIVGATTGASISVQGDTASAAQGDVTVQATDGTCTTNHLLTVREPSSMTAAQAPTVAPGFVQNLITYTVRDQFGNSMGANICVDETITECHNSHAVAFTFGDAGTNAAGQVSDNLSLTFPGGIPGSLCIKLDQTLTGGGCGPLLHNTIVMQAGGIALNPGTSCAAGDACP